MPAQDSRPDSKPLIVAIHRRGLWGLITWALALLSCYGTLAILALFSMLGMTLMIREDIWAGIIMVFVSLSAIVVALGIKQHRKVAPLISAVIGVMLIIYSMIITYYLVLEILGFALLGIATLWDYRLRRSVTLHQ